MYAAPVAKIHTPTAFCFYTSCLRGYSVFDSLEPLWSRGADDWNSNRLTYRWSSLQGGPFSFSSFLKAPFHPLFFLSGIFLHTCQRNPRPGLWRGRNEESGSPHRPPPPCSSPILSALLSGMMSLAVWILGAMASPRPTGKHTSFLAVFSATFFHWAK